MSTYLLHPILNILNQLVTVQHNCRLLSIQLEDDDIKLKQLQVQGLMIIYQNLFQPEDSETMNIFLNNSNETDCKIVYYFLMRIIVYCVLEMLVFCTDV